MMVITMRHEMPTVAIVVIEGLAAMTVLMTGRVVDPMFALFHHPALIMVMPWITKGGIVTTGVPLPALLVAVMPVAERAL